MCAPRSGSGLLVGLLGLALGCGEDARLSPAPTEVESPPTIDGGVVFVDGGVLPIDAGPMFVDAGPMFVDAGPAFIDAGPMFIDAGLVSLDGGVVPIDGGVVPIDAGPAFIDGGVPSLSGARVLEVLARGAAPYCWFTTPHRAVAQTAGEVYLAVGRHRGCTSRVDTVAVYASAAGAAGLGEVYTRDFDYSGQPMPSPAARGLQLRVSSVLDGDGRLHVASTLRFGTATHEPARLVHTRREPTGAWATDVSAFSAGTVQAALGNRSGAPYAFFGAQTIAFDPQEARVRYLARDEAWFQTRWNLLETTASVGTTAWTSPSVVYTRNNGVVDRGIVGDADQLFEGGASVQVWHDKHSCSVHGRERVGGVWTQTLNLALPSTLCTTNASASYDHDAAITALWVDGDVEVYDLVFDHSTTTPVELFRLRRSGGVWSVQRSTHAWLARGTATPRPFVAGGRPKIAFVTPSQRELGIYDVDADASSLVYASPTLALGELDLSRVDPRLIAWVEEDASGVRSLLVADLAP